MEENICYEPDCTKEIEEILWSEDTILKCKDHGISSENSTYAPVNEMNIDHFHRFISLTNDIIRQDLQQSSNSLKNHLGCKIQNLKDQMEELKQKIIVSEEELAKIDSYFKDINGICIASIQAITYINWYDLSDCKSALYQLNYLKKTIKSNSPKNLLTLSQCYHDLKELQKYFISKKTFCKNKNINDGILNSKLQDDFNSYEIVVKVPEVIEKYQLQYGLDLTGYYSVENIHVYNKNPNFNLYVKKYQSQNRVMAVKIYEAKNKPLNMEAILFEVKVLELLSKKADNSNAFLEYYGWWHNSDTIYFGMEYHPITLAEKIRLMSESSPKKAFTKQELESNIKSLLTSFALMEDLNIYHRDIKPSNILVSDQGQFKIIDFGASEFKDITDQSTYNRFNFVVGTPAFMAPEIYEAHLAGKDKAVFARGTSDVFSLGMTILQMIAMRDLSTLNMAENNQRLLIIVNNEVNEEWLKSLLLAMLKLNYKERPRFNNCLKYIQSGYTKIYIHNN